jgi:hypothetical protein
MFANYLKFISGNIQVEIEIKAGKACLRQPKFDALLNHGLQDTFMPPGLLLLRLQRSGLNLLPLDDDAKFARKALREPGTEALMHMQLSEIAHCFEIKGSPFNSSRPANEVLFSVRLNNRLDELLLDDVNAYASRRPAADTEPGPEGSDAPPQEEDDGDEPERLNDESASEHGQMSGIDQDLLLGNIHKVKKLRVTVHSWIHILASRDHFETVDLDQRGIVPRNPEMACRNSQSSLRRLLVTHYESFKAKGKMPYDLKMMFEVCDQRESTLQLQESVKRTLNLVRTLVFC